MNVPISLIAAAGQRGKPCRWQNCIVECVLSILKMDGVIKHHDRPVCNAPLWPIGDGVGLRRAAACKRDPDVLHGAGHGVKRCVLTARKHCWIGPQRPIVEKKRNFDTMAGAKQGVWHWPPIGPTRLNHQRGHNLSAYIATLKSQVVPQQFRRSPTNLKDRFVAWHNSLPEFTRNRMFSMRELEEALKTQGKYLSPVLLNLGWERKRLWTSKRQYHRFWVPPAESVG
jgi:hypothetical protein